MTFSFDNLLKICAPSIKTAQGPSCLFLWANADYGSPESWDWKNPIFACENAYLTSDFLVLWLNFIMHVPFTGQQDNKCSVFFLTRQTYMLSYH